MVLCKGSLWTVGSGKGGVGKSFLAVCMGITLARSGKSVVLADANITSPDLHGILGIKLPGVSLRDVVLHGASLSDALVPTPEPNLSFVSCGSEELGRAELQAGEPLPFIERLRTLDADCVVVDAGTGTAPTVLDFLNAAKQSIVVSSPDPASMRCTFRFIRNAIFRRVQSEYGTHPAVLSAIQKMNPSSGIASSPTMADFLALVRPCSPETASGIDTLVRAWQPNLLVSMADSEQDQRVAEIIRSAVKKMLRVDLQFGGMIPFDFALRRTAPRILDFGEKGCAAALQIRQITQRLAASLRSREHEETPAAAAVAPLMGLNNNLVLLGRDVHVQTEDLGAAAHGVTTQVFCGGRVILSKKSEYPLSMRDPLQSNQLVEWMRTQHFPASSVKSKIGRRKLQPAWPKIHD